MACYKSALIDLDCRWANKGQAMNETIMKYFEMKLLWDSRRIMKGNKIVDIYMQPDRLRRVDTRNSEAIVGSANIDEIAELNRND
jgi:hypothetical protein